MSFSIPSIPSIPSMSSTPILSTSSSTLIVIESKSSKPTIKYASDIKYPDNHFAMSIGMNVVTKKLEPWYVGTLMIGKHLYMVKINPSDSRGFRSLVILSTWKPSEMHATLNRPYTLSEHQGLGVALAIVSSCYEKFGMIGQIEVAGNNSQSLVTNPDDTSSLLIGNSKEPGMLHGHVIGRGDPKSVPIMSSGLQPGPQSILGGPVPGSLFNMRGDGKDSGNETKVGWNKTIMHDFALALGHEINRAVDDTSSIVPVVLVRSCINL